MIVEQELVEDLKPLRQVLIRKIDGSVRDTRSMSSNRVRDMSNTNCVQMLAI